MSATVPSWRRRCPRSTPSGRAPSRWIAAASGCCRVAAQRHPLARPHLEGVGEHQQLGVRVGLPAPEGPAVEGVADLHPRHRGRVLVERGDAAQRPVRRPGHGQRPGARVREQPVDARAGGLRVQRRRRRVPDVGVGVAEGGELPGVLGAQRHQGDDGAGEVQVVVHAVHPARPSARRTPRPVGDAARRCPGPAAARPRARRAPPVAGRGPGPQGGAGAASCAAGRWSSS